MTEGTGPGGVADDATRARTLRRSVVEGGLYALMAGLGELYFVADAIRLGASATVIVLVATLPVFVGSLGALGAVQLLARAVGRRALTVGAVLAQTAVLTALSLTDGLHVASPTSMLVLASLYQALGQAANTSWSSWFGDVVPAETRGDYFARRNRWVYLLTFAGLLVGGLLLQHIEASPTSRHAGGGGFALIFGLAAGFRLVSAWLLATSWEPPFAGLARTDRLVDFLRGTDGRAARRILPLAGGFLFAVALSSPFFAPFMFKALAFDYRTYMIAQACLVAAKLLTLPGWGRALDRHGPRQVYLLAAVLVASVPLPWVFVHGLPLVLFAQALSGSAWGAYEVSLFTLMLDTTEPRHRPFIFAAHSVSNGTGQLLGGLTGAALFALVGQDYRWIFFISFALRMAVALAAPRLLGQLGSHPPLRRRALFLTLIGLRPNGGATLRPVAVTPPPPPPPRED
ncbi:MAG: MFS transporter [Deltaproteobacteria bacterium]|nr:MFS transporter [Deltaproteobacteria bacterium]